MKRFLITIMILALAAGAAAGQDKQGAGQDNQVKPKWDMEVAFAARDMLIAGKNVIGTDMNNFHALPP